ncbi:DUF2471 family protein [Pandoraea norimbergensis]|uniref:DUF222 domain-containing protein n=1 Tax=Pandoraea norimbergensis TaxID=93219 RepID=A0ABM5WJQ4_9BURK|nr:DUF2471 family protein [Pandoraea norimbergensis]ALS60643.1 hypothetical protein AT302_13515 [Pandoraea norimbergensis]
METIDWDQLALSAAERDLAGIVREIAARYAQHHRTLTGELSALAEANEAAGAATTAADAANTANTVMALDWRTLVAIADEAEADIGLHARHEAWVLAHVLRLPGDEALRRAGELPALDANVDLHWPDAPTPAVFRAIVAAFAGDDSHEDTANFAAAKGIKSAQRSSSPHAGGPACSA